MPYVGATVTLPVVVLRSGKVRRYVARCVSLRLRHRPDLLHEGHHVEVLTALLDLVAVEVEYPGCARGLALARGGNRGARAFHRSGLCTFPRHLNNGFVTACDGVGHSALDVWHRASPAFERRKNLSFASELASGTHLVVGATS